MGERTRKIIAQENMPRSDEENNAALTAAENKMLQSVAKILVDKYPGPNWSVYVDLKGGIMGIQLPEFMKHDMYFRIMTDDLQNEADLLRRVRNAGGELLERFGLRRGIVTLDELRSRRAVMPLILPDKVPG